MTTLTIQPPASALAKPLPSQADDDETLLRLWLYGRPETTRRVYAKDAGEMLAFIGKPLRSIGVGDLHMWQDTIHHLAPASQCRKISSVKALFGFAQKIGCLQGFNPAGVLKSPKLPNKLAQRILTEADCQRMIGMTPLGRDRALLRLAYAGGLRLSELAGLRWEHIALRDNGASILTIHGKGGKTRFLPLPSGLTAELLTLRTADTKADDAVFRSRKGGTAISATHIDRLIAAAAKRAGIPGRVSPHWLRHCHASHALDRGAPIHVVQSSLGHSSLAVTSRYVHAKPSEGSALWLAA